jgi:DNA-binding NarL/FixJ family response regulator
MNQPVKRNSFGILIADPLELRRACIASLLRRWTEASEIEIIEADPDRVPTLSKAPSIKLILLVIGSQGVRNEATDSWITVLSNTTIPLVLVSEQNQPEEVFAAIKGGAQGFIPMSVAPSMAIQALKFIMAGGSYFPPTALFGGMNVQDLAKARLIETITQNHNLTTRQQQVLERLGDGASNKLIARQLDLRESTVKVHIRQIMRKLRVRNRTQAALLAKQWLITRGETAAAETVWTRPHDSFDSHQLSRHLPAQ